MRRLAFAAIAAALAAAGVLAAIEEHDDDRDQASVREFPEAWRLTEVGADGRSLRLAYDGGGCAHGHARAVVRESRSTVRIRVMQRHTVRAKPSSEVGCRANLVRYRLVARLERPIAGRQVEGNAPINRFPWARVRRRGDTFDALVPRVVGLAAGDAVEALGHQRFRARLRGATVGRVASQRPGPDRPYASPGPKAPSPPSQVTLHH